MKNLSNINIINIMLMLISMSLAFVIPIQLFLLSYIILGPLHYLTEISWLKDRSFFMKNKEDKLTLLIAVSVLLLGTSMLKEIPFLESLRQSHVLILYISFFSIIGLTIFKDNRNRLFFFIAVCLSSFMLINRTFGLIFAIYLTTIIHVYVFTGIFILSGIIKSPTKSGIASFIIFLLIPCLFFIYPNSFILKPNEYFSNLYNNSFLSLNTTTLKEFFNIDGVNIYTNEWSIALSRFFAFAYTYHYLNWFSKTKIIKWNQISKKRLILIITIWIFSLVLYGINPLLGYKILFILSYSHVLLEFPLNGIASTHIFMSIKNRLLSNS